MGDCYAGAKWYASKFGWRVLPLKPKQKIPLLSDWTKQATTEAQTIGGWWAQWPEANVGIATGRESGIWVLDVDPRHQGDESLHELLHVHGALPDTPVSMTGGGGLQYFFRYPAGRKLVNRANVKPGLDVRGDGGQVVGPPSIHPSGVAYAWDIAPHDQALADAPAWLLDLVCEPTPKTVAAPPPDLNGPIVEGGRNEYLFRRACRLRRSGCSQAVMLVDLRETNATRCRPPLDDAELQTIASSAVKYPAGDGGAPPQERSRAHAVAEGGTGIQPPTVPPTSSTPPAPPAESRSYELNETGNAQRFRDLYGRDARYCHTWGAWVVWNQSHWEVDDTKQVERMMTAAIHASLSAELTRCEDDKQRRELTQWLKKNLNDRSIHNSLSRASSLLELSATAKDFDRDAWMFTVANGTLDLRTGEIHSHRQADMITRWCPIEYHPRARDQRWEDYLLDLTGGDAELVGFLARAAGYSMTGETKEQAVFMLTGPGGTGKSTFLESIQGVIGNYAYPLPFEVFLANQGGNKKFSLANVEKMRMVVCEESSEGKRFSSDLVKLVTGGTPIEAEAKNKQPFAFVPKFKVWFVTNDPPWVSDTDTGFWRRMRLVKCESFPRKVDTNLRGYLKHDPAAQQAVLAWMVAGVLDYVERGLAEPLAVLNASASYRQDQDPLIEWLEECTIWDHSNLVSRANAYASYSEYARKAGATPIRVKGFTDRLRKRGASDEAFLKNQETKHSDRAWQGFRLRGPTDLPDVDANVPPNASPQQAAAAGDSAADDAVDSTGSGQLDTSHAGRGPGAGRSTAPSAAAGRSSGGSPAAAQPVGKSTAYDEPPQHRSSGLAGAHARRSLSDLTYREEGESCGGAAADPDSRAGRLASAPHDGENCFDPPAPDEPPADPPPRPDFDADDLPPLGSL